MTVIVTFKEPIQVGLERESAPIRCDAIEGELVNAGGEYLIRPRRVLRMDGKWLTFLEETALHIPNDNIAGVQRLGAAPPQEDEGPQWGTPSGTKPRV